MIVKAIDEIPEKAKFLKGAELSKMVEQFKNKVVDLRSLYGFRLLLKKRAAEYKKSIGEEVAEEKLHDIFWNTWIRGRR